MHSLWIGVVVFVSIFTQSVAGFGMALVAMPLLAVSYDLAVIAPLIALVGIAAKLLLLAKYGRQFDFRSVGTLTLASLAAVPLGVWSLEYWDKDTALTILGIFVLGYALINLMDVTLPTFKSQGWAVLFGGMAGFLGGAFNASGPPVVVYADNRAWKPGEFKGNLQGYALINGAFITANHAASGNLTPDVWEAFALALPAVVLGVWMGVKLDRWINPASFRKIVLWLLVVLGMRLLLG